MRMLVRGVFAAALTAAVGCGGSSATKNNANPNAKQPPGEIQIDPRTTGAPGSPGSPKPAPVTPAAKPTEQ